MANQSCPVNDTIALLKNAIADGSFKIPKTHRIASEVLDLMEDLAWGRGGEEHVPALETLVEELDGIVSAKEATQTVESVRMNLLQHREVFVSHAKTHNCPSGACIKLAPAPCQMTCPAGIDVPTYVSLIGMGKDAEAIEVIRKDNPFPWVCGLVCTRPCEFMCVRARIDTPIAIKHLKAFAAERAMAQGKYVNPPKEPDNGHKVCIIGAGPGGLSCAYYLALMGYQVQIIEALPSAGGMTLVGIPRYRLPREVIDREVNMLEDLGVDFRFNTRFGEDVLFEELKAEGFSAFFFAIGAHRSFQLNIPGENEFHVTESIDLLKRVALGERFRPGKKVIVIGGGNVAIDAARTCIRLGCEEVTIAYRRTRNEMPADEEEVEQAEEEGIHMSFLTVPTQVLGYDHKISGLKCLRAKLVKIEKSDRMSPVPVEGSDYIMDADMIISAIGQQVDMSCMASLPDLKWTKRNTIDVNMISMESSEPGIFAAGDAVTGPATVIEAIGGGKRAAQAIHRYLCGIPQPKMPPVPVRRGRMDFTEMSATDKMILKRPEMNFLNLDRRKTTFQQAELGYSERDVREEAQRCLRCDICRRCGECVAVCRDKMKIDALQMGYLDFDHPVNTDFRQTENRCITCGACATNCPNEAMVMEDRDGERLLSLCGTILNRQKLLHCENCGAIMGPRRYIEYVRKRIDPVGLRIDTSIICDACLRKKSAASSSEML